MATKDREIALPIAGTEDLQILYRRSSARPVEYAVLLQVRDPKGWKTRVVADNSHVDQHIDEHHFHRYVDEERQPAEPLPFDVAGTNDAMAKVIRWFADDWRGLI